MSTSSITSSSDIGVAVGQDPKTEDSPYNREPEPHEPPNSPLQVQNTCRGLQGDRNSHAGELMADRRKIHAVDYKLLAIPEPHAPCFACGKKGSGYVEKLTAERRARPKDEQAARRLCRKCYDAAVRRDRAAAPPLPGVINLGNLERCSGTLGKCSVCNLSSAVYFDRATGTKLCKACHSREVQRQGYTTGVPV